MTHNQALIPALSIVVLSHNRADVLENHLQYLLSHAERQDAEVILVDNASSDNTPSIVARLKDTYPALKVHLSPSNLGVAAGRNMGIGMARAPIVLSLDDDAQLAARDWIIAIEAFNRNPSLGILAPRVIHGIDGHEQGYSGKDGDEIANFHGAGHFIRLSSFISARRYDEYCTFGGEEIDLSMRMKSSGYLTIFTDQLIVRHSSLVRTGPIRLDRHLQWGRSYAYVYAKNLAPMHALTLTIRRLGSYLFNHRGPARFSGWAQIIRATREGFADGRRVHSPISVEAQKLYRSRKLGPEFGNVPIILKVSGLLRRKLGHAA